MKKILIVEDDRDIATLLETILQDAGYKVSVVHNGADALGFLKDNTDFDLIITDIIMPGTDGYDLIHFVKSQLDIKIIAMSGGGVLVSSKNAIQTIEGQVDACIEKPVQVGTLLKHIERVLNS